MGTNDLDDDDEGVGKKRIRKAVDDDERDDDGRGVRGRTSNDKDEDEDEDEDDRGREDDENDKWKGGDEQERTATTNGTNATNATTTVFGGPSAIGGFGAASSGAGFSGFGGLKSTSGGFGGFAAAVSTKTSGGFASAPSAPVFGSVKTPIALFGAGKKNEVEEEEGEDDPEAEVANDTIRPVVELEVVETKTGEEDETCAFRTEGALFEYVVDGEKGAQWVERGRGDLRLNEGESGSRIVMRAKGNYRLMLNAALFKGQKFKLMEGGKGVSFTCKNAVSGADAKMTTFAVKMRAAASNAQSQADGFHLAATKAIAKLERK